MNLPSEMSTSLGRTYSRIGIFSLKTWARHRHVVSSLTVRLLLFPGHVLDLQLWIHPTIKMKMQNGKHCKQHIRTHSRLENGLSSSLRYLQFELIIFCVFVIAYVDSSRRHPFRITRFYRKTIKLMKIYGTNQELIFKRSMQKDTHTNTHKAEFDTYHFWHHSLTYVK